MPGLKYKVTLTQEERQLLVSLISKGKCSARKQTRARVMLLAADGKRDADIIEALGVSAALIYKTRQRCVEEGVEAALEERPRPGGKPRLDDRQSAHLIAIACSTAPDGHAHWTLRLLAGKAVELGFVDSISHETVRKLLKKHAEAVAKAGMVHPGSQR